MTSSSENTRPNLITSLSGIDIDLGEHFTVDSPTIARLGLDHIAEMAKEVFDEPFSPSSTPLLDLSARRPYDPDRGRIDVLWPGRWDTETNLVFMRAIHQTGPSPGEWEGTVVYARFDAPASASYLIVGNFSGHDCTMRLSGPWGDTEAHTATTSDPGAVLATWSGSGPLFFTMTCQGSLMGYLESLQVFQL